MSASYLHTVLLDGAKPFLYRNGVRSLLGVPEGDGGEILFSSAVQPVGFAYANPQFMGEPHISPYRPDLAANPAFVRQFTPLQDQARKSSESYAGAEASGEHRVMPQGMAQQNTIGPAQEPDTSVTKSSDASQGPAPVIEKATLHVPNAPQRNNNSSTLSFSGQRHHLSGKAEEEFQHALPSKQSRPTSITRELSDTPSINATHSLETLAQMNSRTGHGLNRAADRIEQLRTAVRELAMKQSSSREQTRGDEAHPQQHQAPAPAQRIIVVKQPSTQAKIPYAFLERSYLSRFRVRNLR